MNYEKSPLMRIPAEIRLLIYEYLFEDEGHKTLAIRNKARHTFDNKKTYRRSVYRVLRNSFHRRCYETTYSLQTKATIHPEIMAVNRKIYSETSHILYAQHAFDFGGDIEAVVPFLQDLTPSTRALVQDISIRKESPIHYYESERLDWAHMCRYLQALEKERRLQKLRIVVEGGKPPIEWTGPKDLVVSDFRLLSLIKHDSMEWIAELSRLREVEEIEITPDIRYLPQPTTTSTLLYAAFSASIDTALVEFLKTEHGMPAKACQPASTSASAPTHLFS